MVQFGLKPLLYIYIWSTGITENQTTHPTTTLKQVKMDG